MSASALTSMKLAIGTAQFGLNYGISNTAGQTGPEEVRKILALASSNGIQFLDTAAAYGESERVLGEISVDDFNTVTKLKPIPKELPDEKIEDHVISEFNASLDRLKTGRVYGYLLHNAGDIRGKRGELVYSALSKLRRDGAVEKIGVSIYDPSEAFDLFVEYELDLVQLPMNIFDQRWVREGALRYLKSRGVEIHVRSAFLQGLFFINPDRLTPFFADAKAKLAKLNDLSVSRRAPLAKLALDFVCGVKEVDHVVCGVNDSKQLQDLIASVKMPPVSGINWSDFEVSNLDILNPARWPKKT